MLPTEYRFPLFVFDLTMSKGHKVLEIDIYYLYFIIFYFLKASDTTSTLRRKKRGWGRFTCNLLHSRSRCKGKSMS